MESVNTVRSILLCVIVATVAYNLIKSVFHYDNISSVVIAICTGLLAVIGLGEDLISFFAEYIWVVFIVLLLTTTIITVIAGRKFGSEIVTKHFVEQENDDRDLQ